MQVQQVSVNLARVEDLVAERLVRAMLEDRHFRSAGMADRLLAKAALRLVDRVLASDPVSPLSLQQQVVQATAELLVRQQKAAAAQESKERTLRAIRNPNAPHLMEELRQLAKLEAEGKRKGARVPLLNMACQDYGSFSAALREVESAG